MKLNKKLPLMLLLPFIMSVVSSCNSGTAESFTIDIVESSNPKFYNIDLNIKKAEMQKYGYEYGDIIDLTVTNKDNSKTLSFTLPYVTNYNEAGTFGPCLCNYEDSEVNNISIAPGLKTEQIDEDCFLGGKCEVKLNKKAGYKKTLDLVSVTTKLTYEECGCDNMKYANCRDVIAVGDIGKKVVDSKLFRGSSPISNKYNKDRYMIADNILRYYEIDNDVSLSLTKEKAEEIFKDKSEEVGSYVRDEIYTKKGNFMTVNIGSDFFRTGEGRGGTLTADVFNYLAAQSKQDESYFIHCNEGKDRTGFIIMIIEALCGVSLDDLVNDYMLTFCNYYNITKVNNKEKYDAMANLTCYRNLYSFMIDADSGNDRYSKLAKIDMLNFDSKSAVIELSKTCDLEKCARKYLNEITGGDTCAENLIAKFSTKIN